MANCHNKLFKKIVVEEPTTFMSKILDRLFPSKKSAPKIYVAYAISVCEYILNPSNQQIQVSESAIKFLISKYLQKVLNKEKLVSSDEDEAATISITAAATTSITATASKTATTSITATASKTVMASKTAAAQEKEKDQEEDQEYQGQEEQEQEEGQEEQEQEGQEEQEQEEDIFNLIIGQEIGNQKDEVKGGGDNDLYNYSSSNEDELFKSVKKI